MSNEKKLTNKQKQIQLLLQKKQRLLQAKQKLSQKLQATDTNSAQPKSE